MWVVSESRSCVFLCLSIWRKKNWTIVFNLTYNIDLLSDDLPAIQLHLCFICTSAKRESHIQSSHKVLLFGGMGRFLRVQLQQCIRGVWVSHQRNEKPGKSWRCPDCPLISCVTTGWWVVFWRSADKLTILFFVIPSSRLWRTLKLIIVEMHFHTPQVTQSLPLCVYFPHVIR